MRQLLLWLLLRLRLRLRCAGWRLAEWVGGWGAEAAGADSSWTYWLADSWLLALRVEGLLHIGGGFFERIPDEFPLDVLFAAVVDLDRRGVHFAGDAG
jgi:hypothetical protein